jgi:hypothetical protein
MNRDGVDPKCWMALLLPSCLDFRCCGSKPCYGVLDNLSQDDMAELTEMMP